jgi:signal transduction histidine kinase/DNA-binding response OmpR family regulator
MNAVSPTPPTDTPAFPVRAVVLGVAAMLLIAVASVATTWLVGNRVRAVASSQVEVLTAAAQLQRQRELLELYATIAIATGDEGYAFRYGAVQPQLRQTLRSLRRAIDLPENRAAILGVEQAEREITAMEFHALDLAVAGRREAAKAVFERRRYQQFANAYRSGLQEIQHRTHAFVARAQADTDRFLTLNLAVSLVALLLIGLSWLLLLRRARAWARQLEEARRRAERATAAKSDFLAVMSHEMRTPLHSIIGFADLALGRRELKGELRRQVELVQAAGHMLLTVINDLLDFSKIEAGAIELADEAFALETLADNAVSIVRPGASDKGIDLRVQIDPRLHPFYRGDENRLRQVLLNLLNNAVKFTEAGFVALSISRSGNEGEGDTLRFAVQDTGPGIPPEVQGRLFQPFAQADASVTRAYGGTGLGLSIARRLVEAMGGRIGFDTEPGSGSTFRFEVSLAPAAASARPEPEAAPAATPGGASILLVDDLAINRQLALAMLEPGGHRVDVAEGGEQAVRLAAAKAYDLILMDVQMPGMDGLSAAREIRKLPPPAGQVPILAMTANVLPHQVAEIRRAGMNGHVPKPMTRRDLERAIARALPQSATAVSACATFDEVAFLRLAAALPPSQILGHAQDTAAEAESLAEGLTDGGEVARRAHKLVSGAAWLGLERLSARARDLERACREGGDVKSARAKLAEAAGDVAEHVLPRVKTPAEGETARVKG